MTELQNEISEGGGVGNPAVIKAGKTGYVMGSILRKVRDNESFEVARMYCGIGIHFLVQVIKLDVRFTA